MKSELIEKFFRRECSLQEAKQVALYLKANPNVLEKYMSAEEWKLTGKKLMPEDFWNEAWLNVQKKNKLHNIIVSIKRITAVAASFIIIASVIYYLYPSAKTTDKPVVTARLQPKTQRESATNKTYKILNILLQDSSLVKLSPASTIQYDVPFADNKREIFLEGEAEFHVVKNKKKPFTVYAGEFSTTALGTVFSVKRNADKNSINVKLFQGKVVIHSTDNNLKGWKKDVYLLAGEQLKFNAGSAMLTVEKINGINQNNVAKTKKPVADSSANELSFSNTFLPKVFQKLSAFYNTQIEYDSVLIDTMSFTGTISRKDSLPLILQAISQMNNLNLIKRNDEFIISKNQQ